MTQVITYCGVSLLQLLVFYCCLCCVDLNGYCGDLGHYCNYLYAVNYEHHQVKLIMTWFSFIFHYLRWSYFISPSLLLPLELCHCFTLYGTNFGCVVVGGCNYCLLPASFVFTHYKLCKQE